MVGRQVGAVVLCHWALLGVAFAGDPVALPHSLSLDVFKSGDAPQRMLASEITARLKHANQRSTDDWRAIGNKAEWETFRDARIARLRESLGGISPQQMAVKVHNAGEIQEDGYVVRKISYESRPGCLVTANL